jgi:ferric-dicitrate binding protein FerR (iron transport regulator)
VNANGNDIKKLLTKYLNGTLSDAERRQVEDWYSSFDQEPGKDVVFDNDDQERKEYQFILANIHNKLNINPELPRKYSLYKRLYRSPVMKIAAILILAFFTAASFYYLKTVNKAGEVLSLNTIEVKAGEMKTILLADGTKIWLNAATKFSYPKQFSSKSREVSLIEGEAFFEVAHDEKKPFIVHSKGVNTQVLGTSFNISAYGYAKKVRVSVATGKVGVSSGKNLIGFLTPNEEISYGLVTKKYLKTITRSAGAMSWIKGEVVLDQVDFESLKEIIFNNYHYVITGDKKLNKLHFSATIKRTDSIISVMELISSINHTSYTLKDKTITMH